MEDSGPEIPKGSVHIEDLSESKELCIDVEGNITIEDIVACKGSADVQVACKGSADVPVACKGTADVPVACKGTADVPVACEEIIEDRPTKIIRKLSGVGGFDEDAKVLLTKIAESLGLDVLDKVSEKLCKGRRGQETSMCDDDDQFASQLNHIEESIHNISSGGASKKRSLVSGQLADTLKGFSAGSNKSVYTEQFTKIVKMLMKKCREYKRQREQYQFMSLKGDKDSSPVPSDSDSETASSTSNFRRLSCTNEKSSRSRSYVSQASTSTGSEMHANKHRDKSGSMRGSKHHTRGHFGPHWFPQKRDVSPRHGRKNVSTTVTEDTTTASSTETETATATESSVVSEQTLVPSSPYDLRPRKSADREEREYEDFLHFLRRSNESAGSVGVMKPVFDGFAKQEGATTEEGLFCDFLKVRLAELDKNEKRKVFLKIHKVLEQTED